MYDLTMHERLIDPATGEHLFPSSERVENIQREYFRIVPPMDVYVKVRGKPVPGFLKAQALMLIDDFYLTRFLREFVESFPGVASIDIDIIAGNHSFVGVYEEQSGNLVFDLSWAVGEIHKRRPLIHGELDIYATIDELFKDDPQEAYALLLDFEKNFEFQVPQHFGINIKRTWPFFHELFHCVVICTEHIVQILEGFDSVKAAMREWEDEREEQPRKEEIEQIKGRRGSKVSKDRPKARKLKSRLSDLFKSILLERKKATIEAELAVHDKFLNTIPEEYIRFCYQMMDFADLMKEWWHGVLLDEYPPFTPYGLYQLGIYRKIQAGYVLEQREIEYMQGPTGEKAIFEGDPRLTFAHEDLVELLTIFYIESLFREEKDRYFADALQEQLPNQIYDDVMSYVTYIVRFILGSDVALFLAEERRWKEKM